MSSLRVRIPEIPCSWRDGDQVDVATVGERLTDVVAYLAEALEVLEGMKLWKNQDFRRCLRLLESCGDEAVECLSGLLEVRSIG